jgi:transcriptional regulator with XRE-family HTH domain
MFTKAEMWEGCGRLDRLMKARRMSSAELGRRLGVAQATISRYRSGERAPDPNTLAAICRELGGSADQLLGLSVVDPRAVENFVRETAKLADAAKDLAAAVQAQRRA